MGNFVYNIHDSKDGKLYNILGRGELPTVVFGRVIREHSVPGMQYYFSDGRVKYMVERNVDRQGWSFTIPFIDENKTGDAGNPTQLPVIFTVPEDLDYNRMNDVEYVRQFCRVVRKLDANTMSKNFIIRDGRIVCIKQANFGNNPRLKNSIVEEDAMGNIRLSAKKWKIGGSHRQNQNYFKYRYCKIYGRKRLSGIDNDTLVRETIRSIVSAAKNNEFYIIPLAKRKRRHTMYKSIYEYFAHRFNNPKNPHYGKWGFVRLGGYPKRDLHQK